MVLIQAVVGVPGMHFMCAVVPWVLPPRMGMRAGHELGQRLGDRMGVSDPGESSACFCLLLQTEQLN